MWVYNIEILKGGEEKWNTKICKIEINSSRATIRKLFHLAFINRVKYSESDALFVIAFFSSHFFMFPRWGIIFPSESQKVLMEIFRKLLYTHNLRNENTMQQAHQFRVYETNLRGHIRLLSVYAYVDPGVIFRIIEENFFRSKVEFSSVQKRSGKREERKNSSTFGRRMVWK